MHSDSHTFSYNTSSKSLARFRPTSNILLIQILSLSVSENFHSSSRQLSVYESASFQIEKQFDIIMSFIESYLRRSWYHYDIVRLGRLILKNPWKMRVRAHILQSICARSRNVTLRSGTGKYPATVRWILDASPVSSGPIKQWSE